MRVCVRACVRACALIIPHFHGKGKPKMSGCKVRYVSITRQSAGHDPVFPYCSVPCSDYDSSLGGGLASTSSPQEVLECVDVQEGLLCLFLLQRVLLVFSLAFYLMPATE